MIPIATIFDGYFITKNLENNNSDTILFDYQVGMLRFKESDYNRLFSVNRFSEIKIKFKYRRVISGGIEDHEYEHKFPYEFLNEVYTILNVYNSYHSYSRKKYYFGNKKYLIQLHSPSLAQVLPYKKSYKIILDDRY